MASANAWAPYAAASAKAAPGAPAMQLAAPHGMIYSAYAQMAAYSQMVQQQQQQALLVQQQQAQQAAAFDPKALAEATARSVTAQVEAGIGPIAKASAPPPAS